jgi:tRNA-dihydrouridine synthase A
MIGREAWHNPWSLTQWDGLMAGEPDRAVTLTRDEVELAMVAYMEREAAQYDTWWYAVARSMLGLRHGQRGARRWRQVWSDHRLKGAKPREVYDLAQKALHSSPPVLEEDVH